MNCRRRNSNPFVPFYWIYDAKQINRQPNLFSFLWDQRAYWLVLKSGSESQTWLTCGQVISGCSESEYPRKRGAARAPHLKVAHMHYGLVKASVPRIEPLPIEIAGLHFVM